MATVRELWRYPVKSMAGERLDACQITDVGLEGDRRWALIDGTPNRAGKPLTVRQHAQLLKYRPSAVAQATDIEALAERAHVESGRPVQLRDQPGANFDDAHVLIVNLASVRLFEVEAGMPVDHRRFRANIYVDGPDAEEEVSWLGRRLAAGAAELEVVARCVRCVVITHDPDTTVSTPSLLELLTLRHETSMGMYCQVVRPGLIALGDSVRPI